jgi:hypothetical protein
MPVSVKCFTDKGGTMRFQVEVYWLMTDAPIALFEFEKDARLFLEKCFYEDVRYKDAFSIYVIDILNDNVVYKLER